MSENIAKTKKNLFTVSASPHVRGSQTTAVIMRDVIFALLPASIFAIVSFGINAAVLIIVGVASCIFFEWLIEVLLNKPVTIGDWSAAVTGLLLALNMPVNAPFWLLIVGGAFAMIVVKHTFGGLGCNFVNPALVTRILLLASWPTDMTGSAFIPAADATTTATPLVLMQLEKAGDIVDLPSLSSLFTGVGLTGSIGEVSALCLILGGVYLIFRNVITWRIPVIFIATTALFSFIFGYNPLQQVLAGGVIIGAFFMATDYVTSPNTPMGEIIFAFGCGLLTCIIRQVGSGYPEGVSFSIVIFNIASGLIDKLVRTKKFGEVKANAK